MWFLYALASIVFALGLAIAFPVYLFGLLVSLVFRRHGLETLGAKMIGSLYVFLLAVGAAAKEIRGDEETTSD